MYFLYNEPELIKALTNLISHLLLAKLWNPLYFPHIKFSSNSTKWIYFNSLRLLSLYCCWGIMGNVEMNKMCPPCLFSSIRSFNLKEGLLIGMSQNTFIGSHTMKRTNIWEIMVWFSLEQKLWFHAPTYFSSPSLRLNEGFKNWKKKYGPKLAIKCKQRQAPCKCAWGRHIQSFWLEFWRKRKILIGSC